MHTPYLDQLQALADPARSAEMARYHKIARPYLGLSNPQVDTLSRDWRAQLTLAQRIELAQALWQTDIHKARLAAAKLLTQARIRPDAAAWALIQSWVPDFDGWALADHACTAGQKRLWADPSRLDQVETWTTCDHIWTRRAALVITLPWCKNRNAKPDELAQRARILGWATSYAPDRNWFIQKSIVSWLRDLSKRNPDRVRAFLRAHGDTMKPFARKEAAKHLSAPAPAAQLPTD